MVELVRKGVVFNVADPDQRELFEHASKRSNFSAYVKRLIQRDMEGLGHPVNIERIEIDNDKDAMKGYL